MPSVTYCSVLLLSAFAVIVINWTLGVIGTCLFATVAVVSDSPSKLFAFGRNTSWYPDKSAALYAEAGIELAVVSSSNCSYFPNSSFEFASCNFFVKSAVLNVTLRCVPFSAVYDTALSVAL